MDDSGVRTWRLRSVGDPALSRTWQEVCTNPNVPPEGGGRTLTGGPPRCRAGRESERDDVVDARLAERRVEIEKTADGGVLVDVRPPEAYLGARRADELVASNDRHGHLPGAIDVHWIDNVDDRYVTEPGQLASLYFNAAELDQGDLIVVYGQGNVDPTHTWLVLRALGAEDVRLYDGGFREWANVSGDDRGRYPVETKTTTVIETSGSVGGGGDGGFSCTG